MPYRPSCETGPTGPQRLAPATLPGVSTRRARIALLLLVVAAVAVRIPLLDGAQIDYDEGVYWESLRSMAAGHPLFTQVYSSQPPGFLATLYPFYLLGHSLAAARAGILFFSALSLVATYAAARALTGDERAALLATLIMAADPLMLRQSVALQGDGPAVALGVVALALAAQRPRERSRIGMALALLAGAALALAVLVKLLAVVAVVPVILVLYSRRRLRLGVLGGVLGTAAVLAPFATRLPAVWAQSVASHVSARALHEGGLFTADMRATLVREAYLVALAAAGALLLWRRGGRGLVALLVLWLAGCVALALGQHPLWPHHLLVAVPPLAIAAGGLAMAALPRALAAVGAVAGAVALLVAGERALVDPATADTVSAAVATLRLTVPPGTPVITDDQFSAASAGYDTPPELVDTSVVRLDSQPVTAADVERIAVRDGVRAVYFGTNRLVHLDGLVPWVEQHYPRVVEVGGGATVHLAAP